MRSTEIKIFYDDWRSLIGGLCIYFVSFSVKPDSGTTPPGRTRWGHISKDSSSPLSEMEEKLRVSLDHFTSLWSHTYLDLHLPADSTLHLHFPVRTWMFLDLLLWWPREVEQKNVFLWFFFAEMSWSRRWWTCSLRFQRYFYYLGDLSAECKRSSLLLYAHRFVPIEESAYLSQPDYSPWHVQW